MNKALVVSVTHGKGWGAESVLEEYLQSKPNVHIAAPPDSRVAEVAQNHGMTYLPINTSGSCFRKNFWQALKVELPDEIGLVHSWCLRSIEFAWILSRRAGVPLTIGFHDSPDQKYHSALRRTLIYQGSKSAKDIVTVSEAMKEKCIQLKLPKVPVVIHNGINDVNNGTFENSTNVRGPTVGFLGMNSMHKGFLLVEQWIQSTSCQWILFGELDPNAKSKISHLLEQYPERVKYEGRADNRTLYQKLDIVVLPSQSFESFGLVAVEAFREGIPVVASDVGGLSEVVTHDETGYIFEKTNVTLGLRYLQKLLNDTDTRLRMGKAARQRYLNYFTSEVMSEKWNQFFIKNIK